MHWHGPRFLWGAHSGGDKRAALTKKAQLAGQLVWKHPQLLLQQGVARKVEEGAKSQGRRHCACRHARVAFHLA